MSLTHDAIQEHLNQLTKPPGSLGRLEDLAADLCRIQGSLKPETTPRRAVLFAGDHGVVAAGVSAWPSEVTSLMVANIASGGAASSVIAKATGTDLSLVDVGCIGPEVETNDVLRIARIAAGTADLSKGPAMTEDQFEVAFATGRAEAGRAAKDGMRLVMCGEMGIGNTTPATALAALLLGIDDAPTGPGAGADDEMVVHKARVIADAVARVRNDFNVQPDRIPRAAIAALCGFEIAAMAGFYTGASEHGLVVLVDGVIATAAALIAEVLAPGTRQNMIAAHRSMEPVHTALLERLDLQPYLDWNLRLGEGTGALLLAPLTDAAAAMCGQMATFADLGI